MPEPTIGDALDAYKESLVHDHDISQHTVKAYSHAINKFTTSLQKHDVEIDSVKASLASEGWIVDFLEDIRHLSQRTRISYYYGVFGWYTFLKSKKLANVNLERVQQFAEPLRPSFSDLTSRQLPNYHDIARVIHYINKIPHAPSDKSSSLALLRDRAIILTLADTGMEPTTLCNLLRGHVISGDRRFVIPEKDADRPFINFTERVAIAIEEYLTARSFLDNLFNSPLSLPLFSRHDRKTSKRVQPLSIRTVQIIVRKRGQEALGAEYPNAITPIALRRYFDASTSLINQIVLFHPKIVKECKVQFENGKYDDAILNAMKVVEVEVRSIASLDASDIGMKLVAKAMRPDSPLIKFSSLNAEQEAALSLYRGAIGSFKNPRSHRFPETSDPVETFECLAFASLLMRMLDRTAQ